MTEPLADAALEVSSVTKRYGRTEALKNVSLRVYPGDVYGFLGPNGAGKTTLIRIILGLARPSRGEVRLFGYHLTVGRPFPIAVGALLEQPAFYQHLSAAANLRLFASVDPPRAQVKEAAIRDVIEQVGLSSDVDRRVREYSGGMRQRLGMALALLGSPRLLVLDEPTNGLDPAGIIDIRKLIAAAAAGGSTVFLSSHLLSEVELSCGRIAIIASGQVVAEGTPAEIAGPSRTVVRFASDLDVGSALATLRGIGLDARQAGPHSTELEVSGDEVARARLLQALAEVQLYPTEVFDRRASIEAAYLASVSRQEHP